MPEVVDLWAVVGFFALGAVAVGLVMELGTRIATRGPDVSWRWVYGTGVAAVLVLFAARMRAHHGGYVNVWMPAHWVVSLAFGVAVCRSERSAPHAVPFVGLLLAGQLVIGGARVARSDLVPNAEDRAAGDAVVEALYDAPGPILSPWAAWLPAQAGHAPSVHWIAWSDIDHEGSPFYERAQQMRSPLGLRHWSTALLGNRKVGFGVESRFSRQRPLPVGEAMRPKSGWDARPTRWAFPE